MNDWTPPHSKKAERSLLGAIILDETVFDEVADIIQINDFYLEKARACYQAMASIYERDSAIDVITLLQELESLDLFNKVGDERWVNELSSEVPSAANAKHYAQIIRDKSKLRDVVTTGRKVISEAQNAKIEDVDEFIDRAEDKFFELSQQKDTTEWVDAESAMKSTYDVIEEAIETEGEIAGIPTGFEEFDSLTSGLQPSELTILAARPAMGKTSLSINMAERQALSEGKSIAYFSLEMAREKLVIRMLAARSKVKIEDIKRGQMSEKDWGLFMGEVETFMGSDFFIDDTPSISIQSLRAKARRLKAKQDIDQIYIDYLQLMQTETDRSNREKEVNNITRKLKDLSKDLEIPIIALAQLNRECESRKDKRPRLSDLRSSGSIEQHADLVTFLYREGYYDEDDNTGITEWILAKHRNGPTGTIKLHFDEQYTRFDGLDQRWDHTH